MMLSNTLMSFKNRKDIVEHMRAVATEVQGDIDQYNERVGNIRQGMIHLRRSDVSWLEGDYKQVAKEAKEALKYLPECIDAMRVLGDGFFYKEQYEKAAEAYLALLKKYPENKDIHYQVGRCYLERQDYRQAIDEFNKEIVISGSAPDVHLQLGVANYRMAQMTIEELRGQETSEAKERLKRSRKKLEEAKDHCHKALGATDQASLKSLIDDINNLVKLIKETP